MGRYLIGIDEVGRGAWAGPLLVCAARLKAGKKPPKGLADSKKAEEKAKEEAELKAKQDAVSAAHKTVE